MDKQQKIIIFILSGLLAAALIVLAIVLAIREPEVIISDFIPPEFDTNAVAGMPEDIPAELNYGSPISQSEFLFALCGTPTVTEDSRLRIYFTSHVDNEVWLSIKIYTSDERLIGSSGLLRAGEYVEFIDLSEPVLPDSEIKIKIISYEPDTYYSRGVVWGTLTVFDE